MAEIYDEVAGLKPWRPNYTFNEPLNVVVFDSLVSRLNMVKVQHDNDNILYAGAHGVIYESVDPIAVTARSQTLGLHPIPHVFEPTKAVEEGGFIEEARARELQLAITRASIKSAIDSEVAEDFDKSVQDIIESLRDVKIRVHDRELLQESAVLPRHDMFRALLEASKQHKTITKDKSSTLAGMISSAVELVYNHKTEEHDIWQNSPASRNFAERFATKRKPRARRAKVKTTNSKKTKPEKYLSIPQTPEETFFTRIRLKGAPNDLGKRREWLHEKYIKEGLEFPEHTEEQKVATVRSGVNAYLETYTKQRGPNQPLSVQITDYLRTAQKEKVFKKILTIGNLFAAKINDFSKYDDSQEKPIKAPGIDCNTASILASFQIMRRKLSGKYDNEKNESESAKQIADLLELYIASTSFDYDFSRAVRF